MSEDFTQRATCECYYKFENSGNLGLDNQGQIDLTNSGVVQSDDIPDPSALGGSGPSATKSADFERDTPTTMSSTHAESSEVDDLTALTMVTWVKFETISDYNNVICKTGWWNSGWGFRYRAVASDEKIRFWFDDAWEDYVTILSTNTWYFIAMTYSQTNDSRRIYLGDEENLATLKASDSAIDKIAETTYGFYLGRQGTDTTNSLDGKLCEVAVLSEELSLAELQEIQADGMEGTPAGNPWYYYEQQVGAAQ